MKELYLIPPYALLNMDQITLNIIAILAEEIINESKIGHGVEAASWLPPHLSPL